MFRARVGLSIVLLSTVTGCGMAMLAMEGEPVWKVATVVRTFEEPPHRVAFAAAEVMLRGLETVDFAKDKETTYALMSDRTGQPAKKYDPDSVDLTGNYPAFWSTVLQSVTKNPEPELVTLVETHLVGKTKDGRIVELSVHENRLAGKGTIVSLHIGRLGDIPRSNAVLDQVAGRLASPAFVLGSRDEREALMLFYSLKPHVTEDLKKNKSSRDLEDEKIARDAKLLKDPRLAEEPAPKEPAKLELDKAPKP
jgi:hypothetical protein